MKSFSTVPMLFKVLFSRTETLRTSSLVALASEKYPRLIALTWTLILSQWAALCWVMTEVISSDYLSLSADNQRDFGLLARCAIHLLTLRFIFILVRQVERVAPLSRKQSNCEAALALVQEYSQARAIRDRILKEGRQLVEMDLTEMRQAAEHTEKIFQSGGLKAHCAKNDAIYIEQKVTRIRKQIRFFDVILCKTSVGSFLVAISDAFAPYSALVFCILLLMSLVSLVVTLKLRRKEELAKPAWLSPSLDVLKLRLTRLEVTLRQKGPGAEYLQCKLNSEQSLTAGDLWHAEQLDDKAEKEAACRALHDLA